MMQEEESLDLPPTPEEISKEDVSFGGLENNGGPTLLLAASVATDIDPSKAVQGGRSDQGQEIGDIEPAKMTTTGDDKEKTADSYQSELDNQVAEKPVLEGQSNARAKLFGESHEKEDSFGEILSKKPDALPTAATLFGNSDDASSGLFGREQTADSFTQLINQGKITKDEEKQRKDESGSVTSLGDSIQGLEIAASSTSSFQPPLYSHPTRSIGEENKLSEQNSSLYCQSSSSLDSSQMNQQNIQYQQHAPFTQTVPVPNNSMASVVEHNENSKGIPVTQSHVPMFFNPQSQQFSGLNSNQVPNAAYPQMATVSQDTVQFQNSANGGNSYMYTAPIASVIPAYDTKQNVPLAQKQSNTRLHQSHVPKQTASAPEALFVPDLYGNSIAQPSNQVNIFTPTAKVNSELQNVPHMGISSTNQVRYPQQQYPRDNFPQYNVESMQQYAAQSNLYPVDLQDPGFWEWVKNQDWSEGAQKLGKQILQKTKYTLEWVGSTVFDQASKVHLAKNATDTVLTTLDPGMEEYLNPVVHLAIASQDDQLLKAIRQGFKQVFGHTAAKGHSSQHSLPKLPIGFEYGAKAVTEQLDALSQIDFKFNQPYIHIALQPFLTELQQGCWSCMFCIAVRDCSRQLQLQTFSQPISIPSPCISIAFSNTSQETINYGLDIHIAEAVRLYKPYAGDMDWCSALTGIKLETVIAMAAQVLASDYKREIENPAFSNNDSFLVLPS